MTVNTTFTAGNILTAAEMNAFGRGLMATPANSITTDAAITAEKVVLTYTFTQETGRNYLLRYFEPVLVGSSAATLTARIRITNLTGTLINTFKSSLATAVNTTAFVESVHTGTANGSVTIVATLQASTGTATATRSIFQFPQLYALDIGTGY